MSTYATVNRSISFNPAASGISGYSQSSGGVSNAVVGPATSYFAAGSSNVALTLSFPYATLQQAFLWSDKGMTLKFNSTGSPTPTIILQPGSPFEWNSSDGYFANPFTANVTVVYITCTPASRLQYFFMSA